MGGVSLTVQKTRGRMGRHLLGEPAGREGLGGSKEAPGSSEGMGLAEDKKITLLPKKDSVHFLSTSDFSPVFGDQEL